jgi:hypothetical protein
VTVAITIDLQATDAITTDPQATVAITTEPQETVAITIDPRVTVATTIDPQVTVAITIDPRVTVAITIDLQATDAVTIDPQASVAMANVAIAMHATTQTDAKNTPALRKASLPIPNLSIWIAKTKHDSMTSDKSPTTRLEPIATGIPMSLRLPREIEDRNDAVVGTRIPKITSMVHLKSDPRILSMSSMTQTTQIAPTMFPKTDPNTAKFLPGPKPSAQS